MKNKILIASHKKYDFPKDEVYLPIQVGAALSKENFNIQQDNVGQNISELNPSFCELTALYWGIKNLNYDYLGLVHYRRLFEWKGHILTGEDLDKLLKDYKIILPKKRKYYIETLYSHYAHTFYEEHLIDTRAIISEKYPDFVIDFDKAMKKRSGYMFNMMILPKDLMEDYSSWLFDILFEFEKIGKEKDPNFDQGRYPGRVSERLFNVWLRNKIRNDVISKKEIKELKVKYLEKVHWGKKVKNFLAAKFFKKKYNK